MHGQEEMRTRRGKSKENLRLFIVQAAAAKEVVEDDSPHQQQVKGMRVNCLDRVIWVVEE